MYKSISYFGGLSSLRFFAALLVVMHHAETIRRKNDIGNFEGLSLFKNGGNAVTFFFILSGFLITYLLLKEVTIKKTINIKQFYIKRILRIWPLYFLLFIIGTLILPDLFKVLNINYEFPYSFKQAWCYFVFFLPGLVTFFFGHHLLEPLWSIGVEEVFYLIWAPIFKLWKQKIALVLSLIIAIKIVLQIVALNFIANELFSNLVFTFQFEAMAIGGLGACFVFHRKISLSNLFIYKLPVQLLIYLFLAVYLIFNINITHPAWIAFFKLPIIPQILLDILFVYLIIGVSLVDKSIIKLRSKWLSYLGEISYGIYMYQMLIIFSVILFMKETLQKLDIATGSIVFYCIVFCCIVIVSAISKTFYENPFLALKKSI
jgi:peptidoglycan/LPS O-acetylase OafA/YrhL